MTTVHVRFPDETKDDPDKPGVPNQVKTIVAEALPEYRAMGFVQCLADGSPCPEGHAEYVAPPNAAAGVKLAGYDDDKAATPPRSAKVPASAPADSTKTAPKKAQGGN